MPETLTPLQQLSDAANQLANNAPAAKNRDLQSDAADTDAYATLLASYQALQNEFAQYKSDTEGTIITILNQVNNANNILAQIN